MLRLIVGSGVLWFTVLGCASPKISAPVSTSRAPLSGRVIFLRGGVFGIFSSGFDSLCNELTARGVVASVHPHDDYKTLATDIPADARLVLIGHSWGADDAIRLSRILQPRGRAIDLLIAIDPTEAQSELPANIRQCVNIYQSNGPWWQYPYFRGQRYTASGTMNVNLWDQTNVATRYPRLCHWNLTDQPQIRQQIVRLIEQVCAN